MQYRPFRKSTAILFAMAMTAGLSTAFSGVAQADALPIGGYGVGMGFWGPSAGQRVCDATNVDGICIAWHSVLKGINPARLANCTAWGCDLRPGSRPAGIPWRDDSVEQQLSVVPHDIAPLTLDADAKPKKPTKADAQQVRVEGPEGARDAYGPIVPKVIEVHSK